MNENSYANCGFFHPTKYMNLSLFHRLQFELNYAPLSCAGTLRPKMESSNLVLRTTIVKSFTATTLSFVINHSVPNPICQPPINVLSRPLPKNFH
jgi:hypothetical protein